LSAVTPGAEIDALKRIRDEGGCTNVIQLVDSRVTAREATLILELLDGVSLADIVQ
ncbi:hypothetical protein KIPB_017098, partial [Kipferlia bialata]